MLRPTVKTSRRDQDSGIAAVGDLHIHLLTEHHPQHGRWHRGQNHRPPCDACCIDGVAAQLARVRRPQAM